MYTAPKKYRDLQRSRPMAACFLCEGELYPGDTCWRLAGRVLCQDCAGSWMSGGPACCRVRLREVRR